MIDPVRPNGAPLPVRIERMTLDHLPEVYAIEVSAYPRPWPFKCFVDELQKNRFAHYVTALKGDKVVGYAGIWLVHGEGHITNVAVSYGYRHRKVGEQLITHLMDVGIKNGLETMYLEVRRYNVAAQRLYTRYGFVPIRVRERYYTDNDEDAIELRVRDMRSKVFLDNFHEHRAVLQRHLIREDNRGRE